MITEGRARRAGKPVPEGNDEIKGEYGFRSRKTRKYAKRGKNPSINWVMRMKSEQANT